MKIDDNQAMKTLDEKGFVVISDVYSSNDIDAVKKEYQKFDDYGHGMVLRKIVPVKCFS